MRNVIPIFIVIALGVSSCRFSVSLSGAQIPAEAKTFSVKYFDNNASLVQPVLSQRLTDKLRDRLQNQTNLTNTNSNGDLAFEGEIVSYTLQPVAIQGNETAQLTQLTISINVRFFNRLDESKNFETRFTRYQQFSSTSSFSSIEESLIDQIVDELVEDIFNKALVNW